MLVSRAFAISLAVLAVATFAMAQESVPLISGQNPTTGWKFDNGREFPGAVGSLAADPEVKHDTTPSLKLAADFTKGGQYVQAGRFIDKIDVRELSMWVRNPDADRFTLRLTDGSGQTHQLSIKTEPGSDWQKVVLPLDRFFARRGQADAVTSIAKYEAWGGAKDGKWHGPATGLYILAGKTGDKKFRTMWLSDIAILPRPTEVPGAEVAATIKLDEILEGEHDWRVSNGPEFKGAKGSLTLAKNGESPSLKLEGDFTGGGAYVAAIKDLKELDVKDVTAFKLRVRTDNTATVTVQLTDGTGQAHQRKGVKLTADGQWHDLTIKPTEIAGGEHWGGANDAKWHGPPSTFQISVTSGSDSKAKQPVVYLADVKAEALLPSFAQPAAFRSDFETPLAAGWKVTEGASVDSKVGFKGSGSLVLSRTLEDVEKPCAATSPTFTATPGRWQIGLAHQADLNSPDNSYNAVVVLEALDSTGKFVDRFPIADVFGKHDWLATAKTIELPKGTASARFQMQLNKTHGRFRIDDLAAAFLAPAPRRDDRIARLLFASPQLGNLLFPNDPLKFDITVETRKPLRDSQHTVTCVVRDYWGAEQMAPAQVTLGKPEKKGDRFVYTGMLDLSEVKNVSFEPDQYYELHATIPQEGGEPFKNHTSFAILPEAETKKYKPEEIPFTSRNWDNRIPAFIALTDRLGVRICGLWGGWSSKPPYKPEAPGLEQAKKLGMGWLTTTPITTIERGKTDYDETALRQGVRNLIEVYGKHRPFVINLGNEPHGTGDKVKRNVEAYRIVYEEVKRVDPTIPVVATSVEPNEEYFKLGYGKYCDAYDFHIYETAEKVRRTIGEYQALMKKYDVVKPIWSTELGLNSQGQTRLTVAVEVLKKFTSFFAAGGANVSWFGLLYPDADGKSHGSSGDSHNVFDCRFNRYAPRLDAIAYYHMVNAIAIKKFTGEKTYDNGVHVFLFRDRDNRALQVLWAEKGRQDVAVPLAGVKSVDAIHIDGRRKTLSTEAGKLTLGVTSEPIILLYEGGPVELPAALEEPAAALASLPRAASRTAPMTLKVVAGTVKPDAIGLRHPPFWTVLKSEEETGGKRSVVFTITPTPGTAAHHANLTVTIGDAGRIFGELPIRVPFAE